MKNTQRVKKEIVRTGGARTQRGVPAEFKALMAYWMAYYAFLDMMSEDARFVWLYGEVEDV